jgi:hypothetical protein
MAALHQPPAVTDREYSPNMLFPAQVARRAAVRAERKLAASISASATAAVKQQPAAPAAAPNGGGGGGTRVMIIGE